MIAAVAVTTVFFEAIMCFAASLLLLFHFFFTAIRILSAGESGSCQHHRKGENQQEREQYGCENTQHLFESNAKVGILLFFNEVSLLLI